MIAAVTVINAPKPINKSNSGLINKDHFIFY